VARESLGHLPAEHHVTKQTDRERVAVIRSRARAASSLHLIRGYSGADGRWAAFRRSERL